VYINACHCLSAKRLQTTADRHVEADRLSPVPRHHTHTCFSYKAEESYIRFHKVEHQM
jgi:hypothetical protein